MSIIETLITDRTQADVDALKRALSKPMSLWDEDDQKAFFGGYAYFLCIDGPLECLDGFFTVNDAGNVRGAYNASDLNRVGTAVEYLVKQLAALGYTAGVTPKTDWMETDYPAPEEMKRYLQNIKTLRGQLTMPSSTPRVPESMENIRFDLANDIEQILIDIDDGLRILKMTPVPCGAATCGGDYL